MTPRRIQMGGPLTGVCPVCGRTFQLKADGTIRHHGGDADPGQFGRRAYRCRGADQFPAPSGRTDP